MMSEDLIQSADGKFRCWWHGNDPEYLRYHDEEWGWPCNDDIRLFEKICLEGFQAGLSWLTILRKRDNFRAAFAEFDFEKIMHFTDNDVERLLLDTGIVRHREKIKATINNAKHAHTIIKEFGSLSAYFWRFEPEQQKTPRIIRSDIPTQTKESRILFKDLKKRGFKFVGATTIYSHMQAMGLVNDHLKGCCMYNEIEYERQKFKRPL
ncbi:MAG: DNA-3-methyladenine glycosylase I [Alphaproteobacteria bacterium]|nr:DNA-3-methyladenine glycosylase I [Alphaproteobacteria bacterium]